ncbi:MAG: efflux RND transporter periplasmic adaptor subunit [Rhizomicrobium sp.]
MSNADTQAPSGRRRLLLTILAVVVVVGVVGYGLYWLLHARFFEGTNDAYVGGDVVAITSRENATVLALHADNTQAVRRGQVLIEFDPATAKIAMDAAEANLARAIRNVRTDFSKVTQARAQLNAAHVSLAQAQSDYRRRSSRGMLSPAKNCIMRAMPWPVRRPTSRRPKVRWHRAEASVQGTAIASNPDVLSAIARLRQAVITLGHMKLIAPVDGVVAQRTVQIGQQVAPGTPLMAVVPLQSVWIDANFKEGQLADMRIGQPVDVTADIYGGGVTYRGKVIGLGAGSGSAFALLPPQNASGNWIKIVQRVPVRSALDPQELRDHPLRVGLSVDVSVDVRDTSGPAMASNAILNSARGEADDNGGAATDALIKRILSENGA